MKKFVFYLILTGLLYGTIELMAFGGLLVIGQVKKTSYQPILTSSLSDDHRRSLGTVIRGETRYVAFSPELGWTIKPSGGTPLYRANSQGFRADRDYTPVPAKGIVRIAAFGDSFTHGDQVGNGDTWESYMEKNEPGLEVLNFGVGGFGVDQAFLRYRREGVGFNPQIVLIGFMTTDVNRHINTYRPFTTPRTEAPFTKPRFKIVNGTLTLIENPIRDLSGYRELLERPESVLPGLGVHDYYYSFRYRKLPGRSFHKPVVHHRGLSVPASRRSATHILPTPKCAHVTPQARRGCPDYRRGRFDHSEQIGVQDRGNRLCGNVGAFA